MTFGIKSTTVTMLVLCISMQTFANDTLTQSRAVTDENVSSFAGMLCCVKYWTNLHFHLMMVLNEKSVDHQSC